MSIDTPAIDPIVPGPQQESCLRCERGKPLEIVTHYPAYDGLDRDGKSSPFISCCYVVKACGCRIVGNGTLQHPLAIQFCDTHQAVVA